MDRTQAQFILQSYRPGGEAAGDPAFAEALELVGRDPSLAEWFSEQRRFDEAIAGKLKSVVPPDDLRKTILAAQQASGSVRRWVQPQWFALAAAVAIVVGMAGLWLLHPTPAPRLTLTAFTQQLMAAIHAPDFKLDLKTSHLEEMERWYATHGTPRGLQFPRGLSQLTGLGCRTLTIGGQKAMLFCFVTDDRQMVHLIVLDEKALQDSPSTATPQLAQQGQWGTARWSRDGKTYVLIGMGDSHALERYL